MVGSKNCRHSSRYAVTYMDEKTGSFGTREACWRAHILGLGSCWVGIEETWIVFLDKLAVEIGRL